MNIHQARLREAAIRRASIMAEAKKAGASGIKKAVLMERLKMTTSNADNAIYRLMEEGKHHRGDRSRSGAIQARCASGNPGRGQGAGVPAVRAA